MTEFKLKSMDLFSGKLESYHKGTLVIRYTGEKIIKIGLSTNIYLHILESQALYCIAR